MRKTISTILAMAPKASDVCETFESKGITPFTFADKDPGTLVQEAERLIGIVKNDVYTDCETVGTSDASFKDDEMPYFKQMGKALLKTREYAGDTLSFSQEQAVADFANGKYPMYAAITSKYTVIAQNNPDLKFTIHASDYHFVWIHAEKDYRWINKRRSERLEIAI